MLTKHGVVMAYNALIDTIFESWEAADLNKPFLITEDKQTYSRADFLTEINQLGSALLTLGVCPGDRVAVQAEKSPTAFALYFAVVKIGGVFLPLNTGYTVSELSYFIEDAAPRVVVIDPKVETELLENIANSNVTYTTLDAAGQGKLKNLAVNQPELLEAVKRHEDDLAAILYTSGTTGRSKGAMLSHKNLLSNAITLEKYWQFTDRDVLLHALPIYHTHGLFVAGNVVVRAGGVLIFLPKFDRDKMMEFLPQATSVMGVPTFYTRLLQDDRFDAALTQHIRLFISGSAPLLAETHVEFEARTGHKILERYGMTETNMNTSNPYEGERRAGTVGFSLPGVSVRIVSPETGHEIPVGEIGLIEVHGDNVTTGYWQNSEKTEESFRDDGFFITGDMGMIDKDGYITIVGRDKDLIISGGLNIYPKEIEDVINMIDGVDETAVIGVPHSDFGEAVVAVIVRQDNDKGRALTSADIMIDLKNKLAKFKQPKSIKFVEALPRNTMGKVQKAEMRNDYNDEFQH